MGACGKRICIGERGWMLSKITCFLTCAICVQPGLFQRPHKDEAIALAPSRAPDVATQHRTCSVSLLRPQLTVTRTADAACRYHLLGSKAAGARGSLASWSEETTVEQVVTYCCQKPPSRAVSPCAVLYKPCLSGMLAQAAALALWTAPCTSWPTRNQMRDALLVCVHCGYVCRSTT